ncbi:MAG: CheB methylesterase domain-containing protein [Candidatus Sericytochromatia bacterium]
MTEALLYLGQQPALANTLLQLFRQQQALMLHPCIDSSSLPNMLKRLKPRVVLVSTDIINSSEAEQMRQALLQKGAPPVLFVHDPAVLNEQVMLQASMSWGAFDIVSQAAAGWQALLLEKIELLLPLGRQTQRLSPGLPQLTSAAPSGAFRLVLLGASTGGPQALATVLTALPADFPVPLLVVQHLPGTWTASLAERLDALSALKVREARPLDLLQPGLVLVVPGDQQVSLQRTGTLTLYHRPGHSAPSVDLALNSAIEAFGAGLLAVILTGMGSDGLEGVKKLKLNGGSCLAEHVSSCVVYGMPRSVVEAGLADRVVPLERMAAEIQRVITPTR